MREMSTRVLTFLFSLLMISCIENSLGMVYSFNVMRIVVSSLKLWTYEEAKTN